MQLHQMIKVQGTRYEIVNIIEPTRGGYADKIYELRGMRGGSATLFHYPHHYPNGSYTLVRNRGAQSLGYVKVEVL